jgi:hypothetical protein
VNIINKVGTGNINVTWCRAIDDVK